MNTGIVIQCRMGSTRLPGKAMADICGKPVLQRVIERCEKIRGIDNIIVATTDRPEDCIILDVTANMGHDAIAHAGDMNDVLGRYYMAAKEFELDAIVRVTADCPLLDSEVSNMVVDKFLDSKYDYVTNRTPVSWPDGFDTEMFSFWTLMMTNQYAKTAYDREHVTSYMYRRPSMFSIFNVNSPVDWSSYRLTLDTEEDLYYIRYVYEWLGEEPQFRDILKLPRQHTLNRTE